MNRRSFLSSMLAVGVGSMILPGAGRIWIRPKRLVTVWNPEYFDAEYQLSEMIADHGTFSSISRIDKVYDNLPEVAIIKPVRIWDYPRRFVPVEYWTGCNATLGKKVARVFREVEPLVQIWK